MALVTPKPSPARLTAGRRLARLSVVASASAPGRRPYVAVLIVPTGIGAAIGGFAGDAMPVARALAATADVLITHPNVLNGAMLYYPLPNALYVEGYALDMFAAGEWGLRPVHRNRVGLLLDAAIEPELRLRHLQVADAARATLGLDIAPEFAVTESPLAVTLESTAGGASTGRLGAPGALLRGAAALVAAGCDAVAVVARFPEGDDDDDDAAQQLSQYRGGMGVDALAGVEAVISHAVVRHLGVPCAHAPALGPLDATPDLAPRAAAEELGHTFLPCVLAGLARAPRYVRVGSRPRPPLTSLWPGAVRPGVGFSFAELQSLLRSPPPTEEDARAAAGGPRLESPASGDVWACDVDAVIVPASACGSPAVLSLMGLVGAGPGGKRGGAAPLLIAVEENETVMDVTPERLALAPGSYLRVGTYLEALGIVAAHKAGVAPASLRRDGIHRLRLMAAPGAAATATPGGWSVLEEARAAAPGGGNGHRPAAAGRSRAWAIAEGEVYPSREENWL